MALTYSIVYNEKEKKYRTIVKDNTNNIVPMLSKALYNDKATANLAGAIAVVLYNTIDINNFDCLAFVSLITFIKDVLKVIHDNEDSITP